MRSENLAMLLEWAEAGNAIMTERSQDNFDALAKEDHFSVERTS